MVVKVSAHQLPLQVRAYKKYLADIAMKGSSEPFDEFFESTFIFAFVFLFFSPNELELHTSTSFFFYLTLITRS